MWSSSKHDANPLITPYQNPAAEYEQYQPAVVRVDGDYFMFVKSDELDQNRRRFRLWRSTDGIEWRLTDTTFGPADGSLSVNEIHHPVFVYEASENRYHLYYRADGGEDGGSIGHAVGEHPTKLRDDGRSPALTSEELEEKFGGACRNPQLTDMVSIGSTNVYYGFYWTKGWADPDAGDSHCVLFCAVGDHGDLRPRGVISTADAFPRSGTIIGNVSVFAADDQYCLTAMVGRLLENEPDQRETYAMVGDGFEFVPVSGRVLDTGPPGTWEEKWVYGGSWLKDNRTHDTVQNIDGRARFYYNGQDTADNNGSIGLAEFDDIPSLDRLTEINAWSQSIPLQAGSNTIALPTDTKAVRLVVEYRTADGDEVTTALSTADAQGNNVKTGISGITGSGQQTKRGAVARLGTETSATLTITPKSAKDEIAAATVIGYRSFVAPDVR
ncbi:hypothetical protein [Halorientalis pallida]|uniref:Glycosyl hydrolases family 43 n=1 Tax=Halorientalis pallida TaxID=2479928 RepID=A0A498L1K5_9EURY|nr:hypothetical protein [Halorientalis pallida]RXK47441.1 hypothetical protein EAF64_16840 [Halorientalis pallida]